MTWPSLSDVNVVSFRSSSRSRPLKLDEGVLHRLARIDVVPVDAAARTLSDHLPVITDVDFVTKGTALTTGIECYVWWGIGTLDLLAVLAYEIERSAPAVSRARVSSPIAAAR
jgi:hypothetical protein